MRPGRDRLTQYRRRQSLVAARRTQQCAPDVIELPRHPLASGGKRSPSARREPVDDQADAPSTNVRVDSANQLGHTEAATVPRAEPWTSDTRNRSRSIVKKRTANILLAVFGTVVVCVLLLVAGGVWLAMSVFHRQNTNEATATATLDAARARFNGAAPVFEVHAGGPALTRPIPTTDPVAHLRTMHFILWDSDRQTLTQADVPLALLRFRDSPIDVMQFANGSGRGYPSDNVVSIRLSELERFGSALLLDQEMEDGHRLVVWTE